MKDLNMKWGGKSIKSYNHLQILTGRSLAELRKMVLQGKTVEEIVYGTEINLEKNYYPQFLRNGTKLVSDEGAAEYFLVPESTIKTFRKNYAPLLCLEWFVANKTGKIVLADVIEWFSKTNGFAGKEEFLSKYNGYGYSEATIVTWVLKFGNLDRVIEKLSCFRFPVEYNGTKYFRVRDMAVAFDLPENVIINRRNSGWSIEKTISTPLNYKRTELGYPYTLSDGKVVNTDAELAESLGKDIYYVRNRRRSGWSYREMELGDVGVPVAEPTSRRNNSTALVVDGRLFYQSLQDCVGRMGLKGYYNKIRSFDDKDEALGRAFVSFAKKYNEGYVTPDLLVNHFLHEHEGNAYYCCYLSGEVDYFSSKEILRMRLDYIRVDLNSHVYRNNGVYNTIKSAERFFGIGTNSIRRKVNQKGISYEDAIRELIESPQKGKGYVYNGKTYRFASDIAKKNNISEQTLISRIKSGKSVDESVAFTYAGSIEVDVWKKGRVVGKKTVKYKSQVDLCNKLGLNILSLRSSVSSGNSIEDFVNSYIARYSRFWVPFVNKRYYSLKELCDVLGLDATRASKVGSMGYSEGLTFWESLCKYYMSTEKAFSLHKDEFTCKFDHGTFWLKSLRVIGDEVVYHGVTPSGILKVFTFEEIFAILVESRLGK